MSHAAKTQDEKFLVTLYKIAEKLGDFCESIDVTQVGEILGCRDRRVKLIVQGLMQANFIRKADKTSVYLTDRGCELAEQLLAK